MTPDRTYLSIPQSVERLRTAGFDVSAAQVRRWVRAGRLVAVRLPNGRAQILSTDLDAIVSGERVA